ncbi:MAG: hypothetical protein Kow00121_01100 [Elainellaceae cyanobacterium]
MSFVEEPMPAPIMPLYKMAEWYNKIWALSSVFYESIPANKAGTFFRHLQEMFEVCEPSEFLANIGVGTCITEIGYYCRILCQLEDYHKPEFNNSIRAIISTDYGREKVYVAAHRIYAIAQEIGYSPQYKVENYSLYHAKKDHAFLVSHAIYYALEDILKHHKFEKSVQKEAIEFYHSLIHFVIHSETSNHKLIPSYVTTKLANLLNLILSHPVILTLPNQDNLRGRECLNSGAPNFDKTTDYVDLSSNLTLAAASLEDLVEQLKRRGFKVDVAQEKVAREIATEAQKDPTVKDKLIAWAQSIGNDTVSDVVAEIVKLALRYAGIPLS